MSATESMKCHLLLLLISLSRDHNLLGEANWKLGASIYKLLHTSNAMKRGGRYKRVRHLGWNQGQPWKRSGYWIEFRNLPDTPNAIPPKKKRERERRLGGRGTEHSLLVEETRHGKARARWEEEPILSPRACIKITHHLVHLAPFYIKQRWAELEGARDGHTLPLPVPLRIMGLLLCPCEARQLVWQIFSTGLMMFGHQRETT